MKKGKGLKRTPLNKAMGPKNLRTYKQDRQPLQRAQPMPKKNAKRKAKRTEADDVYGSYFRYVKTLPCAVREDGDDCEGEVTGHHLKSVGAGGKDAANLAPLCQHHHRLIHNIGPKAFDARYFNDLHLYAAVIYRRYTEAFDQLEG